MLVAHLSRQKAQGYAMTFDQRLTEAAGLVESRLTALLDGPLLSSAPERLRAALRHAVLAGGKRFRPCLVIESARLFGLRPEQALDAAAAIECVHCYSLVHDDLPAMDNDVLRRGVPTVWKAFDEPTAILAGDALLSAAFEILASPQAHPKADIRAELVVKLARASGATGMAGGQQLDMEAELGGGAPHSLAAVMKMHRMKTGALIRCSVEAGATLAEAPAMAQQTLATYAEALGEAFQIADDLLDVEGNQADIGKGVGKDLPSGKATSVAVLGVSGARARLLELERTAISALEPFGASAHVLAEAMRFVVQRKR
jgi:farnesyl diphosphate synthase